MGKTLVVAKMGWVGTCMFGIHPHPAGRSCILNSIRVEGKNRFRCIAGYRLSVCYVLRYHVNSAKWLLHQTQGKLVPNFSLSDARS
jgi:hypothetical protein